MIKDPFDSRITLDAGFLIWDEIADPSDNYIQLKAYLESRNEARKNGH